MDRRDREPLIRTADSPSLMSFPHILLEKLPTGIQWFFLVSTSALFALGLHKAGIPAALLIGPMAAGILTGVNGGTIRVFPKSYLFAQAIIGCMIARVITPGILVAFLSSWPLFLGVVLSTIIASTLLGWLLNHLRVLPGTTGIWGSSPGAATAMVVMAEEFGSDARLVAFMQYLRVVCVALTASVIARFWVDTTGEVHPEIAWFPHIHWLPFAETLAVAVLGGIAGRLLRIPSGTMLVPLAAGAVLHSLGIVEIELPEWLLALTYALLGWRIGLNFTRRVLAHASHALPHILLSIAGLFVFCGGLALLLTRVLGVDPLTAYLATSPGGMDSIAIIAASSNVDVSFVMALQAARIFIVVLVGPYLARYVARHAGAPPVSR